VTATLAGTASDAVSTGDPHARYLVYSITKSVIAASYLFLDDEGKLSLDDPLEAHLADPRLPDATLRQLLDHTSGVPDYGRLPEYHEAVRTRPSEPWDDDELLTRALALGLDFAPGAGWAYSNTGYLLLRRILDGFGGLDPVVQRLGLRDTRVAESPGDLRHIVPGLSATLGGDVRGVYDPRWVGHRALISTCADLHVFWTWAAGSRLADPASFVEIGFPAPGFARPSYGLGVMADPGSPLGTVIGHGGGGPGYAAAAFVVRRAGTESVTAVVLHSDDAASGVEQDALRLLAEHARTDRLPSRPERDRTRPA
jgi:D-alanyl-D-alanine carboxypeptidase